MLGGRTGDILPLVIDGPLVGWEIPRHEVEESGLPRPVGPDDPRHLVFMQQIVHLIYGDQFTEPLRNPYGFDNFCAQICAHGRTF
ncbi:MAG: hypothetical protein A3J94_14495 [Syntrophus sp. RIFOXYC2_FULL_54_9]|nr:MAG: hypothetical protein A3J94_14495 [Syntrophus sp. RIFOXYC2_FULL_54_9]